MVQKTRKRMNKKGGKPAGGYWEYLFLQSTGRIDKNKHNAVNIITAFIFSKLVTFEFTTFKEFLDGWKDEIDSNQNIADSYLTWKSCNKLRLLELICMNPDTYIPKENETDIFVTNTDVTNDFIKDTLAKIRKMKPAEYKALCKGSLVSVIDNFFGKIITYLQHEGQCPIISKEEMQNLIQKANQRNPPLPGLVEYLESCNAHLEIPNDFSLSVEEAESNNVEEAESNNVEEAINVLSNEANGYSTKPMGQGFTSLKGIYWFLEPKSRYGMARGKRLKCNDREQKLCDFEVTYIGEDGKKMVETQMKNSSIDQAWIKNLWATMKRATSPVNIPLRPQGGKKSRKINNKKSSKKNKKNKRSKRSRKQK
jgi:hypothetical protein